MCELSYLSQIVENISEGIISIDRESRISLINRRAKEIFGISYRYDIGHPGGKIEQGDIVIIGDNSLGTDDGEMEDKDLKLLGIEEVIPQRHALVYIGIYGEGGSYKHVKTYESNLLSISKQIKGKKISASIDLSLKEIKIEVDDISFPRSFISGFGHIVILDGKSLEVKFYQSRGYTARGEALRSILSGATYMEKLSGELTMFEVEGEKINYVLSESESIKSLIECSKGKNVEYVNKYDDVNGRPLRCSIYPLFQEDSQVGAFLKFEDLSDLKEITEERDEVLRKLYEIEESKADPFNAMIGESEKLKELISLSKKAALKASNILILGESGTGKSILARMIHNYSNRNRNRFVEINCGALSESLLESELFGYVGGAFTGAKKEGKKGLIEYADGGTLFLDEISEMPLNLQVKLLHVIQDKKIIPVGGTEAIKVDIRLICASNRDLVIMVDDRCFREDLFYRINVMPLVIPPLRERKEDLLYLVQAIVHKISKRDKIKPKTLSNDAFNMLYAYDFPGNIRELENILERGMNLSEDQLITDEDILIKSERVEDKGLKPLKQIVEETERKTILNYLRIYEGDKIKVMEVLGIKKTAFYDKVKKYNIP